VLRPFIDRADGEGESLGRYAAELAAACGLARMATLADPEGGLREELARLLARAEELGAEGGGPRAWLRDLLGSIDGVRASGRPEPGAVNLITSHSAKGLEWPVVIPLGLWREIPFKEPNGLRIVSGTVVFDAESVEPGIREAALRERRRELVRLLYVTLTRSRSALVVPWTAEAKPEEHSFLGFWDLDPGELDALPARPPHARDGAGRLPDAVPGRTDSPAAPAQAEQARRAPGFPRRILPHELAAGPDPARSALHESSADAPPPVRDAADPLEYGVWWHEAAESVPWDGDPASLATHRAAWLAKAAELGFAARASEEWERLAASEPWRLMRDPRWTRLAEAGIFAPLVGQGWIDGVVDLVLHDPCAGEVWIVDWKTNRRAAGEDDAALLGRLAADYQGQLAAYGACVSGFFPGCPVRLWVYSTVAGAWAPVAGAP
jgi:ATP-dependent exoDNAse (exonuclease V) beta subunit